MIFLFSDTFHSIHVQPENQADGDVPGDLFNEHFPDKDLKRKFQLKQTVTLCCKVFVFQSELIIFQTQI